MAGKEKLLVKVLRAVLDPYHASGWSVVVAWGIIVAAGLLMQVGVVYAIVRIVRYAWTHG